MKLQDIEFGIGFNDEMVMAVTSKKKGISKVAPIVITNRIFHLLVQYLEENGNAHKVYLARGDRAFKLSISMKEMGVSNA